ncbi:MAG: hypothetical protein NVS3B1_28010 [Marmoricola sp.]
MTTITRKQAEQALAAVRAQFARYLEPLDMGDGTVYPATMPEPKLSMDWGGEVAILWEEGPDEWAMRATGGGTSETERIMIANAAKEFGYDPQAAVDRMKVDEPITWPKGVYAEPYYSFVLCLYPE